MIIILRDQMKKISDIIDDMTSKNTQFGGRHGTQNEYYLQVIKKLLKQDGLLDVIVSDSEQMHTLIKNAVRNLRQTHGVEWIDDKNKDLQYFADKNRTNPYYLAVTGHMRNNT